MFETFRLSSLTARSFSTSYYCHVIFSTANSRFFFNDNSRLSSSRDTTDFPMFARYEFGSAYRIRAHTGVIYRAQEKRGKGGSSVQFRIRIVGR